jgi:hypothetical protein
VSLSEAKKLKQMGFKKWYERQLIDGHIYLVLALFCVVLVACGFELVSLKDRNLGILGNGALIFIAALVAWQSMIRYQRIMLEAEYIGGHAECSNCGRYGFKWPVDEFPQAVRRASESNQEEPSRYLGSLFSRDEREVEQISAFCGRCQHRWRIDLAQREIPKGF